MKVAKSNPRNHRIDHPHRGFSAWAASIPNPVNSLPLPLPLRRPPIIHSPANVSNRPTAERCDVGVTAPHPQKDKDPWRHRSDRPESNLPLPRPSSLPLKGEKRPPIYPYRACPVSLWPSRDPIGERGGVNLYGMVGNNAVGKLDYIGLATLKAGYKYTVWDDDKITFDDEVARIYFQADITSIKTDVKPHCCKLTVEDRSTFSITEDGEDGDLSVILLQLVVEEVFNQPNCVDVTFHSQSTWEEVQMSNIIAGAGTGAAGGAGIGTMVGAPANVVPVGGQIAHGTAIIGGAIIGGVGGGIVGALLPDKTTQKIKFTMRYCCDGKGNITQNQQGPDQINNAGDLFSKYNGRIDR